MRPLHPLLLSGLLALLLTPTPAVGKPPRLNPQAAAMAAVDFAMLQALSRAQAQAQAAPGDVQRVYGWGGALTAAAQAGTLARGKVEPADLDAFFAAAEAVAGDATLGGEVLGMASGVALAAGRPEQALALAERALATKPSSAALTTLLQLSDDPTTEKKACTSTLAAAASDIQRYDTLTACNAALGATWASAGEQAWYAQETQRRADAQAAHLQQLQAQSEAQAAAMAASAAASRPTTSASSGQSSAPAAPTTVSVSMKITCGERVRVFQGRSANSGGTYGWESPNSVRSLTVPVGNVICIANERDQVQSCWTASGTRASLEVGCGGFMQR